MDGSRTMVTYITLYGVISLLPFAFYHRTLSLRTKGLVATI